MTKRKIILGKHLVAAAISCIMIVVLGVFLSGLPSHRALLTNAFTSLSILAFMLSSFLFWMLYTGRELFDNYSHKLNIFQKNRKITETPDWAPDLIPSSSFDFGDDIIGIILSIGLWLLMFILLLIFSIFFSQIIWLGGLLLIFGIYWIIIRAFKMVSKHRSECTGSIGSSLKYAAGYTMLYMGWLYGLFWAIAQA